MKARFQIPSPPHPWSFLDSYPELQWSALLFPTFVADSSTIRYTAFGIQHCDSPYLFSVHAGQFTVPPCSFTHAAGGPTLLMSVVGPSDTLPLKACPIHRQSYQAHHPLSPSEWEEHAPTQSSKAIVCLIDFARKCLGTSITYHTSQTINFGIHLDRFHKSQ